ncbi:methyl-accepting chemotaxis protein [Castellaniella daejeonensis]|uniref:methyl-accepting chemotaxis protein n=1 Tax=Castellaniella daejeonensis TaxID=659013 RepID=UPI0031DE9516
MSRSLQAWTRSTAFKFALFTLAAIVGIVVLTMSLLWMERGALLQERQIGARQTVETAYGVIAYYHHQAETGVLPEAQAKQQAMDAIRGMRYSGQEYFWINDMTPRMVMHPIKPELEGKELGGMKDPDGLRLFVAFVDTVKASPTHDGYVFYLWPKPGVERPVQKVSYVKEFTPWGWILGSGVYLDTVDAVVWGQAGGFALAAAILALILLVVGTALSRRLVRQLGGEPDAVIRIADRMSQGDLRVDIPVRPGDRASLMHAMRLMRDGIAQAVAQVHQGTEWIGRSVEKIVHGNLDLSSRTEEQAASLQETAASMEQLTSTVSHNAANAQQANTLAATASEVASQGGRTVSQVVETMSEVNASTRQMSDIVGVIDSIAFQTNILALNAAVEAARAGEQGKGFAVVASEVRALAQRSSNAAREIRDLIDDTVRKIQSGAELADGAGQTMTEVVVSVKRVADIMSEITLASREQASGIEQINQAISQMDQVTQQNAALVVEAGAAAQSLNDQMNGLNRAVGVFQLSGPGAAPALPQA